MSRQFGTTGRMLYALLVTVLMMALLAGCGATPTPTTVPPTATKLPAATATPVPAAPVTISWATWGGAAQEELYKQAIAKFEAAQKEIKVQLINTPSFSDHTTKIQTMVAGGTPPDVIMMGGEWIPVFADKGVFADLGAYMEKDPSFKLDDYFPNLLDAMKFRGKFYALPKDFNITVLYYNVDAFDKAGVKYPTRDWTWQDLLAAAQKLTERDASGRVIRYGLCYTNPWFLIWQNGGETFDNNTDPKIVRLTEPPALEAMQFYYDLALKHKVSPTDADLSQGKPTCNECYNSLTGAEARTPDYSWSGLVADLVITCVGGLIPRADGHLECNPLDIGLDSFLLDDVPYQGHHIRLAFERKRGYDVFVDGQPRAQRPDLGPVGPLPMT